MATHPNQVPVSSTGPLSTTQPNRRGLGQKIRGLINLDDVGSNLSSGLFEVVHGFGENLRGTALGAIDTVTRDTSGRNDHIAQEGRLEIQRGMERLGRRTGTSTVGTTATNTATHSYPNTYNEHQVAPANDSMFRRPAGAYKAEAPANVPAVPEPVPEPAGYSTGASYGYPHGHDKAPHA